MSHDRPIEKAVLHIRQRQEIGGNQMKKGAVGLVMLAALVASAMLAGSGGAKPNATSTIAFIPPVLANPAIKALNDGIALKAKALGLNFETIGGQYSPQAQIVAMNAAIQKKVNMILIWPLDPKGIQPSFLKAKAAGIPILAIWSPGVPNIAGNFMYNDGGAIANIAKMAAAELKKEGKPCAVGIIQGIPVVNILNARNIGMEQGAKAAGCTILEKQVNQQDNNSGALPIAQAWKTKYGSKMTAILAYNDPSAEGAIAAKSGSFQPLVTGMNGDPDGLAAVKNGSLFATGAVPNVELGEAMAQVAYDTINHKPYPKTVWFNFEIVTKANVGSYVPWATRLAKGPLQITFVTKGGKTLVQTTPSFGG
jgi:ABC-type sugar transport system substrate-binding protein